MIYFLFFLLGFISCGFFWWISVRKRNQMLEIYDSVFLHYKRRKDFDKEIISRMTDDAIHQYNKIKELEVENMRLKDEKTKSVEYSSGLVNPPEQEKQGEL